MTAQARIAMEPGWEALLDANVSVALSHVFDEKLGPAILSDAQLLVPIDTSRLHNSLDHEVDGTGRMPELIVGSFPDAEGDVEYAAAVELGFNGIEQVRAHTRQLADGRTVQVRAHERHGHSPEQPYLRPAAFQERDLS